MGNNSSSGRGHHEESVDYGSLSPQGIYTGPRDWNQDVVSQLICARRLAPFYRPLEDYDENWDDDQILAARKELQTSDLDSHETVTRTETPAHPHANPKANKRTGSLKEPSKPEAAIYRGAVECPICFLYYPPNINHSRCCDQAICTECFVQIKRNEPTTTHIVSEPAACPYCVQENFGIVYTPPPLRAGIGCESSLFAESSRSQPQSPAPSYPTHKRRQKSFGADSPEVVTTDQIRPDWEAKLAAVRAAVARRANRRIVMRQIGDRLIPVGVTSGRVHALSPEEAQAEGIDNGSRRTRRRQQPQNQNFEQFLGGQDLEELMVMEAIRLSMIDHEEHQRKEAEEKRKQEAAAAAAVAESAVASTSAVGPSTLDSSSANPTSVSSSPSTSASSRFTSPSLQGNSLDINRDLRALSIGRSHTPPLPGSALSSPKRQSPSPAPYSTRNIALSTVSTASVILGGNPSNHSPIANGNATPVSSIPNANATSSTSRISSNDSSQSASS